MIEQLRRVSRLRLCIAANEEDTIRPLAKRSVDGREVLVRRLVTMGYTQSVVGSIPTKGEVNGVPVRL